MHNAEFERVSKKFFLENYYRYSFPISEFPLVFVENLRRHLKGDKNIRDSITIAEVASSNAMADRSVVYKKYKLSNIIVQSSNAGIGVKAEDVTGLRTVFYIMPGVKRRAVNDWSQYDFYEELDVNSEEYQDIMNELDRIIEHQIKKAMVDKKKSKGNKGRKRKRKE